MNSVRLIRGLLSEELMYEFNNECLQNILIHYIFNWHWETADLVYQSPAVKMHHSGKLSCFSSKPKIRSYESNNRVSISLTTQLICWKLLGRWLMLQFTVWCSVWRSWRCNMLDTDVCRTVRRNRTGEWGGKRCSFSIVSPKHKHNMKNGKQHTPTHTQTHTGTHTYGSKIGWMNIHALDRSNKHSKS